MENKVLKEGKIKSIEKALDLLELLSGNKKGMVELNFRHIFIRKE